MTIHGTHIIPEDAAEPLGSSREQAGPPDSPSILAAYRGQSRRKTFLNCEECELRGPCLRATIRLRPFALPECELALGARWPHQTRPKRQPGQPPKPQEPRCKSNQALMRRDILRYLRQHNGSTTYGVRNAVEGGTTTFYGALNELLAEGRIRKGRNPDDTGNTQRLYLVEERAA